MSLSLCSFFQDLRALLREVVRTPREDVEEEYDGEEAEGEFGREEEEEEVEVEAAPEPTPPPLPSPAVPPTAESLRTSQKSFKLKGAKGGAKEKGQDAVSLSASASVPNVPSSMKITAGPPARKAKSTNASSSKKRKN